MTINMLVRGQQLKLGQCVPFVVSDTINYIDAQVSFLTPDWAGLVKWAHFAQGDKVYDVLLDDDRIMQEDGLDLGAGLWQVYLHGNRIEDGLVTQRITTSSIEITVRRSGMLTGEPLPPIPPTAAEQILAEAEEAKRIAQSVQDGEQQRQDAEAARAEADLGRATAEQSRVIAEQARADAEQERKDAEAARAEAEQGRTTAEHSRVIAEQARADAEQKRKTDWAAMRSEIAKSTADADTAASAANAAANKANAATDAANQATEAANETNARLSNVDMTVTMLPPSSGPTAEVTQTATQTTFALGIPMSNLAYATFEVDKDMELLMHSPDGYDGIEFVLNDGELEVSI